MFTMHNISVLEIYFCGCFSERQGWKMWVVFEGFASNLRVKIVGFVWFFSRKYGVYDGESLQTCKRFFIPHIAVKHNFPVAAIYKSPSGSQRQNNEKIEIFRLNAVGVLPCDTRNRRGDYQSPAKRMPNGQILCSAYPIGGC